MPKVSDADLVAWARRYLQTRPDATPKGLSRWLERQGYYAAPSRCARALEIARLGEANEAPLAQEEKPPQPEPFATLPPPKAPVAHEYPRIPAPALVISDLHVPAHDPEWLSRVVSAAVSQNIRRVVIAGDLLDFGHLSRWGQERAWTTEEEVEDAGQIILWLRQYFSEIHLLPGNHDDRLSRAIDRELTTRKLLQWISRAHDHPGTHVHWHHHAYVGETWVVAHPAQYSRVPTRPADQLTAKLRKHVAIGHTRFKPS